MVNVIFTNLRVLQVTMNKQHTNEVTQGTFTTFNVDVEGYWFQDQSQPNLTDVPNKRRTDR